MKGQAGVGLFTLSFLVAMMFFIFGMIFINPINSTVDSARTALTCSAAPSTLSAGNMIMCLIFDLMSPIFIIGVVSVAIGVIIARLLI